MRTAFRQLVLVTIFVMAVLASSLMAGVIEQPDYKREQKLYRAEQAVSAYIKLNRKLPGNLVEAKLADPEDVDYTILSAREYVLCSRFISKSRGFSEPVDLRDRISKQLQAVNSEMPDVNSFSDGSIESMAHGKGYACFVYTPWELSVEHLLPYRPCDASVRSEEADVVKLEAVDAKTKQLGVTVNDPNGAFKSQVKVFTYDDTTLIYSADCKPATPVALKRGSIVTIYHARASTKSQSIQLKE